MEALGDNDLEAPLGEIIKSYQRSDIKIEFLSLCVGSDVPFYDKACVEEGNFAWSDYKLGNTVFINPVELYDEEPRDTEMFKFVDGEENA